MTKLCLFLLLTVFPVFASEQLKWETKKLEFFPSLIDNSIQGKFKFTNNSKSSIKITTVRKSCDKCIDYKLSKSTIPKGGHGSLSFTYNLDGVYGKKRKYFFIVINNKVTKLEVVTHIPYVVRLSSDIVKWNKESLATPKEIKVDAVLKNSFVIDEIVTQKHRFFELTIDRVSSKSFNLIIYPKSGRSVVTENILLTVKIKNKNELVNKTIKLKAIIK